MPQTSCRRDSATLTLACTQGKRNPPFASGRLAVSAVDHDGVKWSQSNGPQVAPSTAKTGTDAAHLSGKSLQIDKADARTRTPGSLHYEFGQFRLLTAHFGF